MAGRPAPVTRSRLRARGSPLPAGSVLALFLIEDGVPVDLAQAAQMLPCPLPYHGNVLDRTFSVNITSNTWSCHACGQEGGAFEYLMEVRRWTAAKARRRMMALGWTPAQARATLERKTERVRRRDGVTARHVERIPEMVTRSSYKARLIARHDYRWADGTLCCSVVLYAGMAGQGQRMAQRVCYTAEPAGGFWIAYPDKLPDGYGMPTGMAPPPYRLPELQRDMAVLPHAPLWVFDDERAVDALLTVPPEERPSPVTALVSERSDMAPLEGRDFIMVARTARPSCERMRRFGNILSYTLDADVQAVLPVGMGFYGATEAFADAGGSVDGVIDWMEEHGFIDLDWARGERRKRPFLRSVHEGRRWKPKQQFIDVASSRNTKALRRP